MKKILIITMLLTIMGVVITKAQSYKVIVNSSNTVTSLSKSDVADMFMKKSAKWSNGEKIVPVDQKSNSSVRNSFSTEVVGKSVGAIKSYWQQYVFAGKGTPPVEKNSDQDIIEFVKSNPGAIGYVSSSANTDGVKVLTIM
jgi:ABC-type phosphate transport system substrate-binding protein